MDVVVTVPKSFGLQKWINEGDPAGSKWSGKLWDFYCGGGKPNISKGERVYMVCENKLRGWELPNNQNVTKEIQTPYRDKIKWNKRYLKTPRKATVV